MANKKSVFNFNPLNITLQISFHNINFPFSTNLYVMLLLPFFGLYYIIILLKFYTQYRLFEIFENNKKICLKTVF